MTEGFLYICWSLFGPEILYFGYGILFRRNTASTEYRFIKIPLQQNTPKLFFTDLLLYFFLKSLIYNNYFVRDERFLFKLKIIYSWAIFLKIYKHVFNRFQIYFSNYFANTIKNISSP